MRRRDVLKKSAIVGAASVLGATSFANGNSITGNIKKKWSLPFPETWTWPEHVTQSYRFPLNLALDCFRGQLRSALLDGLVHVDGTFKWHQVKDEIIVEAEFVPASVGDLYSSIWFFGADTQIRNQSAPNVKIPVLKWTGEKWENVTV